MIKKYSILHVVGLVFALFSATLCTKNGLICHSHDDLGWLKTIEGYYEGKVREIFQTVLSALEKSSIDDPRMKRKFVYSEVGFLKLYLNDHPEDFQTKVNRIRKLIGKGQWEWVNGGISQADSACPHYEDIINNYFAGQNFLKRHFKTISETAWQLDPFGHSKTLFFLARKFGMKHAVLTRISEYQRKEFSNSKGLEFIWKFEDNSSIITHVYIGYSAPKSIGCDEDCKIKDFDQKSFTKSCDENNKIHKYDNSFLVGDDFNFSKAESRFDFLDFVVKNNKNTEYMTFSDYADSFDKNVKPGDLKVFEDDFFVYNEGGKDIGDSWSGYFTTKPRLKYRIRKIGKFLRVVKMLLGFNVIRVNNYEILREFLNHVSEEVGVFLHHDCITGTAKMKVDEDYFRLIEKSELNILKILNDELGEEPEKVNNKINSSNKYTICDYNEVLTSNRKECDYFDHFYEGRTVSVTTFNGPAHVFPRLFKILVPPPPKGYRISFKNEENPNETQFIHCGRKSNLSLCEVYYQLNFVADFQEVHLLKMEKIPPVNEIEEMDKSSKNQKLNVDENRIDLEEEVLNEDLQEIIPVTNEDQIFEFEGFKITFSKSQVKYTQKSDPAFENVITLKYIEANESGHYILKYWGRSKQLSYNEFLTAEKLDNKLFQGIHLVGNKVDLFLRQSSRESFYYTFETLVKKTPDFEKGIDVVLNIQQIGLKNPESKFTTDSNGLFRVNRKKEKILENSVFPVTSYAEVKDQNGQSGLVVFNDRAQGVTVDGDTLTFYIQRSARVEDKKGNDEVLSVNEDVLVEHSVFNYFNKNDKVRIHQLQNLYDIEVLTLFKNEPSGFESSMSFKNQKSDQDENLKVFYPEFARFNFDLVLYKTFLVRVSAIGEGNTLTFRKEDLRLFFPNMNWVKEVDFSFLPGDKAEEVKASYSLNTGEFVTFLFEFNNFRMVVSDE